jgi:D-alanyl-D-alanine carboxypeptidase/D-alanyl-D-alanine-endopeptidase (penicillin-binding protein 4)
VDGSGLSKKNKVSPDQIIDVLKTMYYDFSVRAEYSSSLGVMGVDGSLKKRLKKFPKKRYIRAKTGTLNGSNSLSGYIGAEGGEELAFSILVNTRKCYNGNIMKIQNSIASQLVNFSRKAGKD